MRDAKGKVTGFMVCQYDNVGIFLTSGEDAVAWQRRLIRAQKHFNVHWKEIYKIDAEGAYDVLKREPVYVKDDKDEPVLVKDSTTGEEKIQIKQSLTFLGAEMQVQTAECLFQWRHDEKKLAKWLKSFKGPHTTAADDDDGWCHLPHRPRSRDVDDDGKGRNCRHKLGHSSP